MKNRLNLNRVELSLMEKLTGEVLEEKKYLDSFARVVWSRVAEPGDATAGKIIKLYGAVDSLEMLINRSIPVSEEVKTREINLALERWMLRINRSLSIKDIEVAGRNGISIVAPSDNDWPEQVSSLGIHAPNILWSKGNKNLLKTAALSIVGARAATSYGEEVTREFACTAVEWGFSIVSGAAYGIDAAAHRATLASEGNTIAFVAGGVDRVYPAGHADLLARIGSHGLICSELIPGAAPTRWRFLQRNRNIAAISCATLVTEAGKRSGSLNTAGHASQIGRNLGAVPGPINSVASLGTHKLLKEYDAALICDSADLAELLEVEEAPSTAGTIEDELGNPNLKRVVDAIPIRNAITTENIAKYSGLSLRDTKSALIELEVLGVVNQSSNQLTSEVTWKKGSR